MDANVVRFFLSPEAETRHVMPFRDQQSSDCAAATALITAEFLFSRGLAGQQHGPSFIAPSHGEEISSIVEAITYGAAQQPTATVDDWSSEIREAREVVRLFRKGATDRVQTAQELKRRVPRVAALLMEGAFQWAVQLRRLYEEDLLRPLALHTEATQDILDPEPELVREWVRCISDERKAATHREREKINRDAQALTQAILLDRQAGSEPDLKRRYVLVTADHALLDAYAKWFWSANRPPGDRFILRLPQQYSPILNSFEMSKSNDVESVQVTRRAFAALDSLFDNLQRADPQYVERLPFYRLVAREPGEVRQKYEDFYGFNPFAPGSRKAFDLARELWEDSFRAGVVLNAWLMNKRTTEFDFLEALLRDDVDFREEIYQHQARSLERIEAAHTAYATRLNVRVLRAGKGFKAPQRAYPALRARFVALSDLSITEVLDGITSGDEDLLAQVDRLLSREDSEAYFLAACIAHRCGHWSAAGIYAARTLELLKIEPGPDDVSGDISFLYASSIRYALASSPTGDEARLAEVGRALNLLDEGEKACEAKGDAFGRARALSERCALRIMRLYYRWLSEFPSPADEIAQLRSIDPDLTIAADVIAKADEIHDPEPLRRLLRQLASNRVSGWVYARVLAPHGPEAGALAAIAQQDPSLLVAQLTGAGAAPSLIMEAECLMASLVAGRSSQTEVLKGLELIAERARVTDGLLEMDRLEVARFIEIAPQLPAALELA